MHKSVYRRFEAASVLLYDRMATYRPDNMRVHVDFKHYFNAARRSCPNASPMTLNRSEKKLAMSGGSDPRYNSEEAVLSGGLRDAFGLRRDEHGTSSRCREWTRHLAVKNTV
jgi:hypothetical protein